MISNSAAEKAEPHHVSTCSSTNQRLRFSFTLLQCSPDSPLFQAQRPFPNRTGDFEWRSQGYMGTRMVFGETRQITAFWVLDSLVCLTTGLDAVRVLPWRHKLGGRTSRSAACTF